MRKSEALVILDVEATLQYRIVGAIRETGEEVDITLTAATPSAAEHIANQLHIMVESLEPIALPVPVIQPVQPMPQLPAVQQQPPVVVRPVQTVQTIEKTGKGWKGLMLLCVFCMGLGVLALCAGDSSGTGVMLIMVGLVVYILASIGAWWEHG